MQDTFSRLSTWQHCIETGYVRLPCQRSVIWFVVIVSSATISNEFFCNGLCTISTHTDTVYLGNRSSPSVSGRVGTDKRSPLTTERLEEVAHVVVVHLLVYVGCVHGPAAALNVLTGAGHHLPRHRHDGCLGGEHPQPRAPKHNARLGQSLHKGTHIRCRRRMRLPDLDVDFAHASGVLCHARLAPELTAKRICKHQDVLQPGNVPLAHRIPFKSGLS